MGSASARYRGCRCIVTTAVAAAATAAAAVAPALAAEQYIEIVQEEEGWGSRPRRCEEFSHLCFAATNHLMCTESR
jgi:hypothetical protein